MVSGEWLGCRGRCAPCVGRLRQATLTTKMVPERHHAAVSTENVRLNPCLLIACILYPRLAVRQVAGRHRA